MTLKKSGDGIQRDITLPFDSNTIPAFAAAFHFHLSVVISMQKSESQVY